MQPPPAAPIPQVPLKDDGSIDWFGAFVHFDQDGSGVLSLVELRQMFEELGHPTQRDAMQAVLMQLDRDADMEISYCEFIRYFEGGSPARTLDMKV